MMWNPNRDLNKRSSCKGYLSQYSWFLITSIKSPILEFFRDWFIQTHLIFSYWHLDQHVHRIGSFDLYTMGLCPVKKYLYNVVLRSSLDMWSGIHICQPFSVRVCNYLPQHIYHVRFFSVDWHTQCSSCVIMRIKCLDQCVWCCVSLSLSIDLLCKEKSQEWWIFP